MGFIVKAVKSVIKTVVGIASKVVGGVFGFLIGGSKPKKTTTPNTLSKTLDPEAFKKIILGKTAAVLDTRYWEVYGPKGERFVEVINFAGHRVNAILETYYENVLAFDAAGAAQGMYNGVVTRQTKLGLNNQTGIAVGGGTKWTAAATNDGNAYGIFDWLPDEKKLPNGIPTRVTQIVEGALVYDPRRDSTVAGGSGTHRINDRTTWAYATLDGNGVPIGRNNCLQSLWYLLGWTVPTKDAGGTVTGEMLVCGRGVQPEDINLATFVAGANACEAAGYYTDLVLSTEDDHTSNEDAITCSGLIGRLIDPGGLWSYYANVDDTASIAVDLTDADILEGVTVNWEEYKGMSEQFNQVRGKFINPTPTVLYQAFAYPMVRDATYEANLGVKRSKTQDFRQVLDSTLAQRLARLLLNQGQYQGEFSAGFNYRAGRAQAWSVVRYTSERFGWTKLFRVWRHDISTDSGITMLLKEIHPSIWAAGTVNAALAPSAGLKYDPTLVIDATNVVVALAPLVGANGDKADGFRVSWDAPPTNVRRTEIRYRLVGTVYWKSAPPVERDITAVLIGPELSGAIYEVAVRHISINEIPGNWIVPTTAPANGVGQFQMGVTGTVNYAAIAAAGGTASWSGITGAGKPQDNADVTLTHVSSGFTGQAAIATDTDAVPRILAMRGDNFARNGFFTEGASQFYLATDATYVALGTTLDPASHGIQFAANPANNNNSYFYINGSVRVPYANDTVFVAFQVKSSIASSVSIGMTIYSSDGSGITSYSKTVNVAALASWQQFEVAFDLDYRTAFINCYILRAGALTATMTVTNVRVAPTSMGATLGAVAGNNMFRGDAVTVMTQAEVRTIEGISSGFSGQGALSLLSTAAWGTHITGRPTELTDGRIVAGIDASGDLARNIPTARLNTSNVLRWTGGALYAGELTADTTLTHISSGFTGQGALAIRGTVLAGTHLRNSLDTFTLGDNDVITGNSYNSGGGMLPNWNIDVADSDGKPAGIRMVEGSANRALLTFGDSTNTWMRLNSSGAYGVGWPAIPINDKQTYRINIRHRSSAAAGTGLFIGFNECASALVSGKTHVGYTPSGAEAMVQQRDSYSYVVTNGPMPGVAWVDQVYIYTPTAGTRYASMAVYQYGSGVTYDVEYVQLTPLLYEARVNALSLLNAPAEAGANVTLTHISSGFTGQAAIATDSDAIARILAMRGDNLARNGDFSEGQTNFYLGTGASYVTLGAGYPAPHAIQFAGTIASAYFYVNGSAYVPFSARRLFVSCDIHDNGDVTQFQAVAVCLDAAGSSTGTVGTYVNTTGIGFAPFDFPPIDVPANTVKMTLYIMRTGGTISHIQWVTNVRMAATQRRATRGSTASTDLFRSDGVTVLTQAEVRTLEGIASGFTGQGALALLNSLNPATSQLLAYGSVPPTIPDSSFTYTSTTTTITISWPNMTVYRVDGSTMTISASSQAFTGLTAGTSYKVYPYVVDSGGSSGTMSFITGGSGSPTGMFVSTGSAAAAAAMYARGNIPMGSFIVSTPASGSGGGGGGGAGWCFHEACPIKTPEGMVEAGRLHVGSLVWSPQGWAKIITIERKRADKWFAIYCNDEAEPGAIVTPSHVFYSANGDIVKANELHIEDMLKADGNHCEVTRIELRREDADMIVIELDEPHLFYGGQASLLSHNGNAKP